jgi:serine-type D-Ala-D-Ala carboxypeptidase/endopeptidase (penicillin-binding protein 4)
MVAGMRLIALVLFLLGSVSPVAAQSLQQRIETALSAASPGTRFGLVVTSDDGTEVVAVNPEGRFIPASNTKIVTTAAAFMTLSGIDQPDIDGGTRVRIGKNGHRRLDVVIEGRGDARLSGAADCVVDCLATLADAVAASVRKVQNVVGDDTHYADERWSPGMSWNNIPTKSGTATSALTLDNNEIAMAVTAGAAGERPKVEVAPYYTVDNQATTVASGPTTINFDRAPNGFVVRLTGVIAAGAAPERLALGIDDPAHYAAWRFREMLVARGVKVNGDVLVRHRNTLPSPPEAAALATLTPPPLIEDLTLINKTSQNLHAELMLRRLGARTGAGSIADGLAVVRTMLDRAGVTPRQSTFSDGGGMSTYNRIAPRGMVRLLRWIAVQPWGAAWRATLPVGGEGMLTRRYAGTALAGRIFAKTGTLNATSALSGYLVAKSGRTLTFSSFANDIPDGDNAARAVDAALLAIAEAN